MSLLIAQPFLMEFWQDTVGISPRDTLERLTDVQQLLVFSAVVGVFVLLLRRRLVPVQGATLMWLAVFTVNPNFAWHYLIWGLPFFLMAGYVREVVVFQVVAIVPLVLFYQPDGVSGFLFDGVYTPLALGLYACLVIALVVALRVPLRRGDANRLAGPATPSTA